MTKLILHLETEKSHHNFQINVSKQDLTIYNYTIITHEQVKFPWYKLNVKRKKTDWRCLNNLSQAVKVMLLHNPTINQPTEIFGHRQENTRPTVLSANPRIMTQRKHPNVLLQSSLNVYLQFNFTVWYTVLVRTMCN